MHLSEGILPLKQAVAASVAVSPFMIDSYQNFKNLKNDASSRQSKPFLTLAVAFCFAMTLLPIPVPILGASSHMCASPMLALILGPRLTVLPVFGILLLQALFFAHGGITTLGANVLTLGVVAPWMTYLLFSLFKKLNLKGQLAIGLSCLLGSLAVYFADSILLSWGLSSKQHFASTFKMVTLGFLPVQLPLSVLESFLTVFIINYLANYRDDFIPDHLGEVLKDKVSLKNATSIALLVLIFALASSDLAFADGFPAIDDTVFTKIAEDANLKSVSLFPWIEGEVQLSFFSIGFFICGYLVGTNMHKLNLNTPENKER